MSRRTSSWVVGMISLRLLSGFSRGTMPASASNGRVSSRMRPLDSAMVSMELDFLGYGPFRA
ncbi:hypothetical protein D3C77_784300 [compost metagenome]